MLIYSTDEKEHTKQVLKVLKQLPDRGLQIDVDKCEFLVKRVKYLGLIISTNGISMDPEKVQVILD